MGAIGSILRGLVLALVVGAVVAIVGALASLFGCASGCSWANPGSDLVSAPAPGLPNVLMAVLLGGLLTLGLAIVLVPRDSVKGLAAIFALLIGADSFLYWLPRPSIDVEPTPAVANSGTENVVRSQPSEATSEPEPIRCRTGSFADGSSCVPCETEEVVAVEPALSFEAIETDAFWQYAKDARVVSAGSGRELTLRQLAENLAQDTAICDARALLVYGSASSDGERDLNVARAQARASNLADAISQACTGRSNGLTIFALSLGQSEATEDVPEDRLVGISAMSAAPGVDFESSVIFDELGYAISEGQLVAPLLDRRDRFPNPWQGPSGTIQGIEVKSRPMRTVISKTPGAPLSCEAPELTPASLDGAPFLRQ